MFCTMQCNVTNSFITLLPFAYTTVRHYTDNFLSYDIQLCRLYMKYPRQMNFSCNMICKYVYFAISSITSLDKYYLHIYA